MQLRTLNRYSAGTEDPKKLQERAMNSSKGVRSLQEGLRDSTASMKRAKLEKELAKKQKLLIDEENKKREIQKRYAR